MQKRIKAAIINHYNCDYPCSSFNDCIFGNGSNTAYDCEECGADEFEIGYHIGAKEQQQIDIDKAIELYEKELREFKIMLNCIKQGCGDMIDIEKSINSFRKSMGEIV